MKALDTFLTEAVGRVFPTAVLHINHAGQPIYQRAVGFVDPDTRQRPAELETLFDLASVTKLFTTTAFLRLVAAGKVGLDNQVCGVLPEFVGKRPFLPYEDP
ncbi:MAG: beta-lactamase family protein, partial [Anaerolineales bacterium]|nr:beta-lactamase family protein [Anaerolineales bacterium]